MNSTPKTHVYMFQSRFAALVGEGVKTQTIRPMRVRMPHPGDLADLRQWSGLPYRSPQIKIARRRIIEVLPVTIADGSIRLDNIAHTDADWLRAFAAADGFNNFTAMEEFFNHNYKLPFSGFTTRWETSGRTLL